MSVDRETKRVAADSSWMGASGGFPAVRGFLRDRRWAIVAVMTAALTGGCAERKPLDIHIRNPWLGALRVAVAPALNFSGSTDFDPFAVADLMASELAQVDGFEVLPVSRTLAVLARQGAAGVESPGHALEIRQALGADAILVFAITEYQPYEPPIVGIAAQLYGTFPGERLAGLDPIRVGRSARPVSGGVTRATDTPLAQVTCVRNAALEPVVREVQDYARARGGGDSPYGWRKYTVSQQSYLRFCCHAAIKELVQRGVTGPSSVDPQQTG